MSRLDQLIQLLAEQSVQQGFFRLASGQNSRLYIDARLTTMTPEGLALIGPLGLSAIQHSGWEVAALGGLTLGADPITYAISYASAVTDTPLRAFTVRKETKQHGTAKRIEGPFKVGDHVAIIEDVITTGRSALQAVSVVQSMGGVVAGVLALVDREEGGRARIEAEGLPIITLTRVAELTQYLENSSSKGN